MPSRPAISASTASTPLPRQNSTVAFWPLFAWLAVQMLASALLFPLLFRTRSTGLLAIAATPLMVQLAGVLAAQTQMIPLTLACAYPAIWLLGLGLWSYALGDALKAKLYAIAAASLLVLGGALVAYLDREFGAPGQTFDWARHSYLGPLVGGITLLEAGGRTGTVWAFLGTFLLT